MHKKTYHTQPREALLALLEAHAGDSLTAEDCLALLLPGTVSKSSVYRLLSTFVAEGTVQREVLPDGRRAYLFPERADCHEHLHVKCARCGRLVHLPAEESSAMRSELLDHYGISLDPAQSLLVGDCRDCREKEESHA